MGQQFLFFNISFNVYEEIKLNLFKTLLVSCRLKNVTPSREIT